MHSLVHIHGWSCGPSVWNRLELGPAAHPTFEAVDDVDGFFDAAASSLPDTPSVVVGWSMGGMLALELALAFPDRVKGLALIGTSPTFTADDRAKGWPERAVRRMQRALKKDAKETLAQFRASMFTEAESEASQAFVKLFNHPGAMDFSTAGLMAGLDYLIGFDRSSALDELACPALWIHGDADAICPVGCLDALPQSHRRLILAGAGHAPHWSQPDAVRHAIMEFTDAC